MLSYILHDQDLLRRTVNETEQAWRSGQLDIKYLCSNSPVVDAVLQETLRLKNGAGALRTVVQDTTIGSKVLQKGNTVMIPFRQLHTNENVWGPTVNQFDPDRFNKKKTLSRNPSYRPFGGGATYCPGRLLAREQVLGFIAIFFHRFHVGLACTPGHNPPFPQMNNKTPSLGIQGPIKGDDVIISVAVRNHG